MKRILSLFVLLTMIFSLETTAFADDGAGIHIESSSDAGKSTVNVVLTGDTNPEMIQFCMNYDPEKMVCINALAGSALKGNSAPVINVKDGKIYFVWDSLNPIKEDGVLLSVEFESVDNKEDAEVSIESGKGLIVAGKDFKNVAPQEVENVTVFEGTENGGESSGGESSKPENSSKPEGNSKPDDSSSVPEESSKPEKVEEGYNNGLTFVENKVTVEKGEKVELDVAEKDEELFWSSSNENVIQVDENGNIETVGPGTAIITVTDESGGKEATCVITVTEKEEVKVITKEPEEKNSGAGGWIAAAAVGAVLVTGGVVLLLRKKH